MVSDAFNALLESETRDPAAAREFAAEAARIATIDAIVNGLDAARIEAHMSKAALARAIGAEPSTVRRLLSARNVNPTLATAAEAAAALGYKLILTPLNEDERKQYTEPMRAGA